MMKWRWRSGRLSSKKELKGDYEVRKRVDVTIVSFHLDQWAVVNAVQSLSNEVAISQNKTKRKDCFG